MSVRPIQQKIKLLLPNLSPQAKRYKRKSNGNFWLSSIPMSGNAPMSTKKAKQKKPPQKPPTSQKSLKCRSSNLAPPNMQPQSKMEQTLDMPQP